MAFTSVPVIDLGSYEAGSAAATSRQVVHDLRRACCEVRAIESAESERVRAWKGGRVRESDNKEGKGESVKE